MINNYWSGFIRSMARPFRDNYVIDVKECNHSHLLQLVSDLELQSIIKCCKRKNGSVRYYIYVDKAYVDAITPIYDIDYLRGVMDAVGYWHWTKIHGKIKKQLCVIVKTNDENVINIINKIVQNHSGNTCKGLRAESLLDAVYSNTPSPCCHTKLEKYQEWKQYQSQLVNPHEHIRKVKEHNVDRFKELWNNNVPISDIMAEFNIGRRSVYDTVARLGLNRRRGASGKSRPDIIAIMASVKALFDQGLTPYQIADSLDISRSRVYKHCRKLGLKRDRILVPKTVDSPHKLDECLEPVPKSQCDIKQLKPERESKIELVPWVISDVEPQQKQDQDQVLLEHNRRFNSGEITPFVFSCDKSEFKKEYERLCKSNPSDKSGSIYCLNMVEHYHRQLWFMRTNTSKFNALQLWEADKDKIIKNRQKYADLRPRSLRRYFKLFDVVPSLFSDALTKYWCRMIEGNVVADPFAGFGNRMCGVCSSGKRYIGIDNNIITANANMCMATDMGFDAESRHADSSAMDVVDCDGIITSPPFYVKDVYNSDSSMTLDQFLTMINKSFSNFAVRDKCIIDFKPYRECTVDRFKSALPYHYIDTVEISFSGMGRKSMHTMFICQ